MQARHRSPGNGVRPNSLGIGGLAAARISPEASLRTHGMYNSEYRSFNRGFGRMPPPKSYPPRRGDIFMEAGRLAAEYLVSQGVLPPNVLPGKWQNGSLKTEFQDFRVQERENLQLSTENRTSALARLGNVVPDAGSGSRRFPDEFNPAGLKNRMRGRRRMGLPGRAYDSDRKNGLWSEKAQSSLDMEGEDDLVSGYHEEQQDGLDGSGGVPTKNDSESELETYEFPDDTGSKARTSSTMKEHPLETELEFCKGSDDGKNSNMETAKVNDSTSNDEMEKQAAMEDISMHQLSVESKDGNDLLRLCSFAKVPTKTRSSLAVKVSKVEPVQTADERNRCDISPSEGPKVSKEEDLVHSFSNGILAQGSKGFDCDASRTPSIQSVEDVGVLGSALAEERVECTMSQSLLDSSVKPEQTSGQGFSELEKCNSMVKDRGDKRAAQDDDTREGTKKPREWPSPTVASTDEYFHLHNFRVNPSHSHKSAAPDEEVVEVIDQDRILDVALFPRGGVGSGIEFREEKQLFPSSFKICDLNLMEASDMNEAHDSQPVLGLPYTLEAKKEVPVDVDLSISKNCNRSDGNDRSLADAKEAIIIEVEDDPIKEDEIFDTSERKTGTVHPSLESFPHHMETTGDLPDAQDGYGLMISELLGTEISNCSSVPADITSLHTEMGLHNGTEILGDDDPIYLSLGEIPISFLGVWEQPTQQYEKPF